MVTAPKKDIAITITINSYLHIWVFIFHLIVPIGLNSNGHNLAGFFVKILVEM